MVGLTADRPFASVQALTDFVGRYREAGVSEFIIYWLPEEPRGQGFFRDKGERLASAALPGDLVEEQSNTLLAIG